MDVFEAENDFYLRAEPSRLAKFLCHAKLYEAVINIPGHFVEAGVFRGASFTRFRKLGRLFHPDHVRRFIGFDVFGQFPAADYQPDRPALTKQHELYGDIGISRDKLLAILRQQGLADNVELVEGDVCQTLPSWLSLHPEMTFAIVNIDLDLYEPTRTAIECLFPGLAHGGVMLLDDYEGFPGAKKAVDDYLMEHKRPERVRKFAFAMSPCYLIKE